MRRWRHGATLAALGALREYAEAARERASRRGMQGLQVQLEAEIAAHRRLLQAARVRMFVR